MQVDLYKNNEWFKNDKFNFSVRIPFLGAV